MTYTDEQRAAYVAQALELMCKGISQTQASLEIGIDQATLSRWLLTDEFASDYARARCIRGDLAGNRVLELALRVESGELPPDAARVSIDAHKWAAGRMNNKVWGDKSQIALTDADGGSVKIESTMTASDATAAYLAALKQS